MKPKKFGKFRGSLAKLNRAHMHGLELKAEIDKFMALKPYELIFNSESAERTQEFTVRQTVDLPDEIPCIAGDFMHNLRSCLDHLAIDLVLFNGRGTSGITFPSADGVEHFESLITKKGGIKKAGVEVVEKLRKLQIYTGGYGSSIRDLHNTDIIDKHFGVIVLSQVFSPYVVDFHPASEDVGKPHALPIISYCGEKNYGTMGSSTIHPKMKIKPNPNPAFEIQFFQPNGFRGKPIPALCEHLYTSVEAIVRLFADDPRFGS